MPTNLTDDLHAVMVMGELPVLVNLPPGKLDWGPVVNSTDDLRSHAIGQLVHEEHAQSLLDAQASATRERAWLQIVRQTAQETVQALLDVKLAPKPRRAVQALQAALEAPQS